nr:sigma-54-dependent Fis family transcriptional regulator [Nitrospinaceae bacterium]NIR54970.1 sigma-54-dependent Fis family transcriptional regulator [Nitrospinaceae bacterium]NIS85383.1 sigma-54-dependent Fis family transcriptional regulator [Nitrospinaceae bacterium]NIT82210.1 sigma-54-dependent Fis family transcriptional regulator [Nitrospinaceae bacterium]NIU44454.1 sigma-54-dependent Fis family transcriptional regulator [Nitrospinaceae bacterium]
MPSRKNVIFIDDDPSVRTAREQTLKLAGYETLCLESSQEALRHISPNWNGVLVTDVKMPGMDGMELIRHVLAIDPELPVVLITGHGDVPMAVDAMHLGAFDFLEKPCPTETFLQIVQNALEKRRLVLEKRALQKRRPGASEVRNQIIGKSPAVERLRKIIDNAADSDADVLITGETGTGKELVAACLHYQGKRRDGVFVAVNCGAIPETLIESELFGHEAGAFTGAQARRLGKFEFANNGTLFLDEIESMPLPLQVKLLRVLQERMVERLGSNKAIPINIRV